MEEGHIRIYKIPQNNGVHNATDDRQDPPIKPGMGVNAANFDKAFRNLVTATLGTPAETKEKAGIKTDLKKETVKGMFDAVVQSYKTMEPQFSKRKWKKTINDEKFARKSQRRQVWAVDAIGEALEAYMKADPDKKDTKERKRKGKKKQKE